MTLNLQKWKCDCVCQVLIANDTVWISQDVQQVEGLLVLHPIGHIYNFYCPLGLLLSVHPCL